MFRTATPLLVGLALLAAPALAHAEEPTKSYPDCGREPTDGEVSAAKGAFQAGNASFNEADYARAIDYWEDAYRRDCTANPLLLNLARAYELAGRKRQAVVALETFTSREPSSGEKDQINRRIDVLKKKISDEDAAAASAPTTAPAAVPNAAPTTGPVLTPDAPPQQASRSVWPWVVMGAGGAAVIVGAASYSANKKKLDEIALKCPNRMCPDGSNIDAGNAARQGVTGGVVLMAVGGPALVGGFIWVLLDGRRVSKANSATAPAKPLLTPSVGSRFAGLTLSGQF